MLKKIINKTADLFGYNFSKKYNKKTYLDNYSFQMYILYTTKDLYKKISKN